MICFNRPRAFTSTLLELVTSETPGKFGTRNKKRIANSFKHSVVAYRFNRLRQRYWWTSGWKQWWGNEMFYFKGQWGLWLNINVFPGRYNYFTGSFALWCQLQNLVTYKRCEESKQVVCNEEWPRWKAFNTARHQRHWPFKSVYKRPEEVGLPLNE